MGNCRRGVNWSMRSWIVYGGKGADWQRRRAGNYCYGTNTGISEVSYRSVYCVINYDTCVSFCVGIAKGKQAYTACVYTCFVYGLCGVCNDDRVGNLRTKKGVRLSI